MPLTTDIWMDILTAPTSKKIAMWQRQCGLLAACAAAGNAKLPSEVRGQRWNFFPCKFTDPGSSVQPQKTLGC